MAFRPAVLSYDDIRRRGEEFLDEFHAERTLPVPIEEIVEFDFELEVVPRGYDVRMWVYEDVLSCAVTPQGG